MGRKPILAPSPNPLDLAIRSRRLATVRVVAFSVCLASFAVSAAMLGGPRQDFGSTWFLLLSVLFSFSLGGLLEAVMSRREIRREIRHLLAKEVMET